MTKILKSFPIVILITLIIQFCGLLKSVFLSKEFGASNELDAFYLANILTVSIFSVITAAISTVLIPNMVDKKKTSQSTTNYMKVLFFISVLLSLIVVVFLFLFRDLINPNFSEDINKLFFQMILILVISQFFRIASSFYLSLLQTDNEYILSRFPNIIPAILPILYLLIGKNINMEILVIVIFCSYFLEMIVYYFVAKHKDKSNLTWVKPEPIPFRQDSEAKSMLRNTLPIIAGSAVFQLQILIINYLAGFFGSGMITILSNTNQIVGIFQGLLISNVFALVYPNIVRAVKNSLNEGKKRIENYIYLTNTLVIMVVWGYASVGKDLVYLLFYRGNFSKDSADFIYMFGLILIMGLPFSVIRDYFYRFYYAIDNTSKPTANTFLTVVFNLLCLFILQFFMGEFSLVLSTSLGTIISLFSIIKKLNKDEYRFDYRNLAISYIVLNAFGFCLFLITKFLGITSDNYLLNLAINSFIFIICFTGVLFLLRKRVLVFLKSIR